MRLRQARKILAAGPVRYRETTYTQADRRLRRVRDRCAMCGDRLPRRTIYTQQWWVDGRPTCAACVGSVGSALAVLARRAAELRR